VRCPDFPAWTVVTREDVTQQYVDIEGNAAVCGDFTAEHFGVGVSIYEDELALLVGGDIAWNHGTVYGQTEYAGELTSEFVNFMYGITDRDEDAAEDCARIIDAVEHTTNLLSRNAERYGAYLEQNHITACVDDGSGNCFPHGDCVIDTVATPAEEETGISYFAMPASTLATCTSITIKRDTCDVTRFAVVDILNDMDGAVDFGNLGFFVVNEADGGDRTALDASAPCLSAVNNQTIWNFNGFTSLTFSDGSWKGSIVAPSADLDTGYSNIEGNVYVNSLSGNVETHHYPVECPEEFETCECATPAPTPELECPCLYEYDFPRWNLHADGNVDMAASDIEGSVAATGHFHVVGGFSVGGSLGVYDGIDWTDKVSLRVGGDIEWESGSLFNGLASAAAYDNSNEQVTIHDAPNAVSIYATTEVTTALENTMMQYVSEMLHEEAQIDYPGYGASVDVSLSGSARNELHFDTSVAGQTAPIGAFLFTVAASDLQAAEEVHITKENGQFVVIDVLDDVDGAFDLTGNSFQIFPANENDVADDDEELPTAARTALNTELVWNFYGFTSLAFEAQGWRGSIYALTADVTYNNGQVNGAIYCKNFDGTGELHYWTPELPEDYECVCPDTAAPTPAPTQAACYETCELESGEVPYSCAAYGAVIASGCSACSSTEMGTYESGCLAAGCDPVLECGLVADDIVEVEVEFVAVDVVAVVTDCEDQAAAEEEIASTLLAATGERSTTLEEFEGVLDETTNTLTTSTQVLFEVTDAQGNTRGSGQCASQLQAGLDASAARHNRRLSSTDYAVTPAAETVTKVVRTAAVSDGGDDDSSSDGGLGATAVAGMAAAGACVVGLVVGLMAWKNHRDQANADVTRAQEMTKFEDAGRV